MFRGSQFDKLLDKATSHLLMEVDWTTILQICDLIRQNDVQPKVVVQSIKKKLQSDNPHTSLYALTVLESVVKNCGSIMHEELASKAHCEFMYELVKSTPHQQMKMKLLELIQAWNHALRNNPKHGNLRSLMTSLKDEGFKFPSLRESDAMFAADSAPEWVDGENCHRCRATFGIVNRKHHCRNCGQVFCGNCSMKQIALPKFGIEKEVRVCDTCYDLVTKPSTVSSNKDKEELPAEYLKSSLAQQNQEPPRKSEDELREEEELQLALALSQSEAEAKEKEKMKITSSLHNTYNVNKVEVKTERSPSPQEEQNPELARYLNRSYWESLNDNTDSQRATSPTAPVQQQNDKIYKLKENGVVDNNLEEFIKTLKSQVEIFINRMKSNSSRGRSIANDSSVQSLFMNITAMHSQLLRYIQEHDDSRLHYERLQDKLTQVKDARAALDALREEHREKLRREAEEAERQRQLQMAHKLDIMRKKKQEYLQYQRQLALQRIQEQEREMQMRQEQQKQQYLMGSQYGFIGSPVHNQPYPQHQINYAPYPQYPQQMMPGQPPQMPAGMPPMPHQFQGPPPPGQQPYPGQMPPPANQQPPAMMMPPTMMQTPSNLSNQPPNNPPPNMQPQFQQQPPQPAPEPAKKEEAQTGELISFD